MNHEVVCSKCGPAGAKSSPDSRPAPQDRQEVNPDSPGGFGLEFLGMFLSTVLYLAAPAVGGVIGYTVNGTNGALFGIGFGVFVLLIFILTGGFSLLDDLF